ncbi:hypothetical protein [Plantactinospora sp. GCM10030261]|uniref:hypothetical protein n=1 Tax=Plantactinospora sp. GCM10030261 TaxID=3273420 RepID=UPI0036208B25
MSIVEELGALVRAAAEDLPVGHVSQALDRLGKAADRLRWVRQESADPMGVPELTAATEHLEAAGRALFVAQEHLATYLAAIGLARDGRTTPPPTIGEDARRRAESDERRRAGAGPPAAPRPVGPTAVRRWWPARVNELTGEKDAVPGEPSRGVTDPAELLRRVSAGVSGGDRSRLRRELNQVDADVGLGLAAVAPPVLRTLATELLGHPPRAQDLPRLRREVSGGVRDLLPGLPPAVLETLLSRVCRMPPPAQRADRPNPADPAVAAGVVAGLLAHRLGRTGRPEPLAPRRPSHEARRAGPWTHRPPPRSSQSDPPEHPPALRETHG